MSRYLKPLVLLVVGLCLVYGGYWFGAHRVVTAMGKLHVRHIIQTQISETRHDAGLVRTLAERRYDVSFQLAQHRYFSRILLIAKISEQNQDPPFLGSVRAQMVEAKALRKELSYKFPNEEQSELWERLIK